MSCGSLRPGAWTGAPLLLVDLGRPPPHGPVSQVSHGRGFAGGRTEDSTMRVLLIDDDQKLARLLVKGLEEERFVVDVAHTGGSGEEMASVNRYEVIVLDWLLPDRDGLAVARRISTPILMLTARDSAEDRVTGLNAGVDDYLTKPFAFRELLARIRALSRRSSLAYPTVLKWPT
jgi:DNA-binding response OmpR family regulator